MKAEERKEIETNSLVLAVQRLRERVTGRTLYYLVGVLAIVVGGVLLYRYLTGEKGRSRDAVLLQLATADTKEKLNQGMEDHRGTIYGSLFKLQLARRMLYLDGLPKLGTDSNDAHRQAANAVADARTHFLDLTGELKDKENAGLVQEAWHAAAEAEEALVGEETALGANDSRGSADKVVEYLEKSAAIFPDAEFAKRDKEKAEKVKANKEQYVATLKAINKRREQPPAPPAKTDDPFGSLLPGLPKVDPGFPKIEPPPAPKAEVPPAPETPVVPPPPTPDPKKAPDPKPADPPKAK